MERCNYRPPYEGGDNGRYNTPACRHLVDDTRMVFVNKNGQDNKLRHGGHMYMATS